MLRLLLRTAFVVVALAATTAVWPGARLLLLWAVGRGGGCSCGDSLGSHRLLVKMAEATHRIGAASHVIERDPAARLELVDTPAGRFWTISNDRFLSSILAEEESETYGGREDGVRPGDVVLDCGANVGAFTRRALGSGARLVVAIEPNPLAVECLRRNFAGEIRARRVVVYPKGVWDREDRLELALGEDGNTAGSSVVFGRELRNKITVPLTTIDLLTRELGLGRVDFIKMDIEGAEKPALRGAAGVIRRFQPRMAIATEHLPDDMVAIPETVRSIWSGYQVRASGCRDAFVEVRAEVARFEPRR